MRVREIVTEDGYFAVNDESILGIVGKLTVVALRDPLRLTIWQFQVYGEFGIRGDLTTRLAFERVVRDVLAALPSRMAEQSALIEEITAECRAALGDWQGVEPPYAPHWAVGYQNILALISESQGDMTHD